MAIVPSYCRLITTYFLSRALKLVIVYSSDESNFNLNELGTEVIDGWKQVTNSFIALLLCSEILTRMAPLNTD